MVGKYTGVNTRKTKTGKPVYDAIIDGKNKNVGFELAILNPIPIGSTVEYSMSEGQYPTLTSIVVTTAPQPVKEPTRAASGSGSSFVPQDFSTPNRLRALEIVFPTLFEYYTSPDRKQKLSIPAIIGKSLAFADIAYNYAVTGNSVVSATATEPVEPVEE